MWRGCGKGAHRPAPSLQVWALPCLYPSKCQGRRMWTNVDSPAKWLVWPDKYYDECKIFECVCVQQQPGKSQQNSEQVDFLLCLLLRFAADMAGPPGALHLFHLSFSHTHLSLLFRLPELAWRQLAWVPLAWREGSGCMSVQKLHIQNVHTAKQKFKETQHFCLQSWLQKYIQVGFCFEHFQILVNMWAESSTK